LFNHGPVPSMEPRFAEAVREMLARGEWLIPIKNGVPYIEYPPLYFWLGLLGTFLGLPLTAAIPAANAISPALRARTVRAGAVLHRVYQMAGRPPQHSPSKTSSSITAEAASRLTPFTACRTFGAGTDLRITFFVATSGEQSVRSHHAVLEGRWRPT